MRKRRAGLLSGAKCVHRVLLTAQELAHLFVSTPAHYPEAYVISAWRNALRQHQAHVTAQRQKHVPRGTFVDANHVQ